MTTIYARSDLHDRWSSVYRRNPLQDAFNVVLTRRLLSAAAPPSGGTVLDAGCGTGYHTALLARSGYRCVGVDISPRAVEAARERATRERISSRATFVVGELERLPWSDGAFELVYCRGVLMHVPRFEPALAELARLVKPGGALVVLESNQASLERWAVALLRLLRPGRSRIVRTAAGLERWSEHDGAPFLVRMADVPYMTRRLHDHGFDRVSRVATELLDINRWPAGRLRDAVIRLNRAVFSLGLPPAICVSNAIVARRRGAGSGGAGRT